MRYRYRVSALDETDVRRRRRVARFMQMVDYGTDEYSLNMCTYRCLIRGDVNSVGAISYIYENIEEVGHQVSDEQLY